MADDLRIPAALTPDLRLILGMPNFVCGPYAHLFREAGRDIPRKSEEEQAFVLHWLLGLHAEHGERWAAVADEQLAAARKTIADSAEPAHG